MRHLALILTVVTAPVLLTGCKNSCRQLAEKLCDCKASTTEKERCLREMSSRDSRYSATAEQQATCQDLLDKNACVCADLQSADSTKRADAKRNCGLARVPDAGSE